MVWVSHLIVWGLDAFDMSYYAWLSGSNKFESVLSRLNNLLEEQSLVKELDAGYLNSDGIN